MVINKMGYLHQVLVSLYKDTYKELNEFQLLSIKLQEVNLNKYKTRCWYSHTELDIGFSDTFLMVLHRFSFENSLAITMKGL